MNFDGSKKNQHVRLNDQMRALLSPIPYACHAKADSSTEAADCKVGRSYSRHSPAALNGVRRHPYGSHSANFTAWSNSSGRKSARTFHNGFALTTPPLTDPESLKYEMNFGHSTHSVSPWLLPEAGNQSDAVPFVKDLRSESPVQMLLPTSQSAVSPLTPSYLMNLERHGATKWGMGTEAEVKRQYHNKAEQRRRDTVKESLAQLRQLLPNEFLKDREKASKMIILQQTVEYVRHLHSIIPPELGLLKVEDELPKSKDEGLINTLSSLGLNGNELLEPAASFSTPAEKQASFDELLIEETDYPMVSSIITSNAGDVGETATAKAPTADDINCVLGQELSLLSNPLLDDTNPHIDEYLSPTLY